MYELILSLQSEHQHLGVLLEEKKKQLSEIGNCYAVEPHGNVKHFPRNCFDQNSMLLKEEATFALWVRFPKAFKSPIYKHEY